MSDLKMPVTSAEASRSEGFRPWLSWSIAWAMALVFVLVIEWMGWRSAPGGVIEAALVGINIDTAPCL
ncbi:MAG: hypothetical protein VX877_12580, partial [Planctomycetota bacterium]|nr:hypothetical protein [Planctomycetota bacterium]